MQYRIPRGSIESSFGRLDPLQRQLGLLRFSSWAKLFMVMHDKFLFSYDHLIRWYDRIREYTMQSDVHYFSPPIFWDRIRSLPYFGFLPCILKSPIHNYNLAGIIISSQFLLQRKRDTANAMILTIIIINYKLPIKEIQISKFLAQSFVRTLWTKHQISGQLGSMSNN